MTPTQDPVAVARERAAGAPARKADHPLKDLIKSDNVQNKFKEIMGTRGASYLANVLQVCLSKPDLMKANPMEILSCAMIGATLDLSLDPNLGYAAIVPYKNSRENRVDVQFQIEYKGFIQLALRSNQYKNLTFGPVFDDEIETRDPIWGDVILRPVDDGWRVKWEDGDPKAEAHIAGSLAAFRLLNGFEKMLFWPVGRIEAHAKKHSKSYNFSGGPWTTNKQAMRDKTVLRALLTKFGPMSIDYKMDQALRFDGAVGTTSLDIATLKGDALEFTEPQDSTTPPVPDSPEGDSGSTSAPPPSTEGGQAGLGIY